MVKDLLSQLDGAKPSDQWDAKFTVLKENVEHHVDEEEGELFSKARKVLSSDKLEMLGDQMAEEKKRQGGTVSPEIEKPGLIKTVVTALFGATKKTGKKKTAETTGKAKATKASSKKKAGGKQATKRATTKAKKTPATKTSTRAAGKPAVKKTAAKAKAKAA